MRAAPATPAASPPHTCETEGVYRKSIATYYLTPARETASTRGKALFAPHGEQAHDESVLELIRQRADAATAPKTYRSK